MSVLFCNLDVWQTSIKSCDLRFMTAGKPFFLISHEGLINRISSSTPKTCLWYFVRIFWTSGWPNVYRNYPQPQKPGFRVCFGKLTACWSVLKLLTESSPPTRALSPWSEGAKNELPHRDHYRSNCAMVNIFLAWFEVMTCIGQID